MQFPVRRRYPVFAIDTHVLPFSVPSGLAVFLPSGGTYQDHFSAAEKETCRPTSMVFAPIGMTDVLLSATFHQSIISFAPTTRLWKAQGLSHSRGR